jgi:hypothetical protein
VANKQDEDTGQDANDGPETSRIISVLAETNRRDRWTVAPSTSMFTFLARSHFDFRQVEAESDVVELNIVCGFGKVTIVVPEGTKVQLSGFSFLASANCDVASPEDATSPLPKIVINANTVFGRISIRTPNAADLAPAVEATATDAATSDADDHPLVTTDASGHRAGADDSPADHPYEEAAGFAEPTRPSAAPPLAEPDADATAADEPVREREPVASA